VTAEGEQVVRIVRGTRRWALRAAAGALAVGLCSACSAPIFSRGGVRRALPKLTVLAATARSASTKGPEQPWLAPLRAAVDRLNATRQDQLGAILELHVFTADQAPGAVTVDSNGQVKSFNMTAYDDALAGAVGEQADLLVTAEGGGLGALTNLDHAKALAVLDAYLARERPSQQVAYYPGAIGLGRIAGRQVALPFQIQPWLMRYDATLFHAIGVAPPPPDQPWTWQQLIDLAPKLLQRDPQTGLNVRWACRVETLPP
jgi:ABC-type glycerol-3-phosphate transport system substrate-binding protein